ncbi:MAG: portal protein [Gammaproteobacteria bacterium]
MIAPALQQAVESAVAEQEEATFGRARWIDASDDLLDIEKADVSPMIDQLLEDFDLANVQASISEVYLNGALYGTGIAKLMVDTEMLKIPVQASTNLDPTAPPIAASEERTVIRIVAIDPREFVIDPSAKDIDAGLGCAHVTMVSAHTIRAKQAKGIYEEGDIQETHPDAKYQRTDEVGMTNLMGTVKLVEYHGLVPRGYLKEAAVAVDENDLVEAVVTIANDTVLLRAVENPFLMGDRSFVAYPHDKVPNRFWGRGISEKGYNPQKQLDAELRARIDALALSVHPMIGMDASRMPRGEKFLVSPGRTILTMGNPNEVLAPVRFPSPDPQTFRQAGDMERMVQMATGSIDSAAPIGINPRNATASGMSMMLAGALKRSKRTMRNIERYFLIPLVKKALWRYIQFDPTRYPARDYKFVVRSTLGIMAREVEQQMLTSMASTTPPASPAYWILMKAIIENSSVSVKDQVLETVDQMIAQAQATPEEPPLNDDALQMHSDKMRVEVEKLKLESRKLDQRDQELMMQYAEVQSKVENTTFIQRKITAEAELAQAQAHVEVLEAALEAGKLEHKAQMDRGAQAFSQALAISDRLDEHVKHNMSEQRKDQERALAFIQRSASAHQKAMAEALKQHQAAAPRDATGEARDGRRTFGIENVVQRIAAAPAPAAKTPRPKRVRVERDSVGKVTTINGSPVTRDSKGLIESVEVE